MQCPSCSEANPPDDHFCEACGFPLGGTPPAKVPNCPKCGAGSGEIDEQGYCTACGHRRAQRERDRIEIGLNESLAGVTDRGLRHHRNEDFLAIEETSPDAPRILVVCDGVSSSQEADLASQAAATEICRALLVTLGKGASSDDAFHEAFAAGLTAVRALPRISGRDQDPPSTTVVAAIVRGREATIAWRGDSRAYWLGATGSKQLTTDHSWLTEIVASGEMTEEQASRSDKAHAITRWLGADCDDDGAPSLIKFEMPEEGRLLLCSDGLWNYAPAPEALAAMVTQAKSDALTAARLLVEFARGQGGRDNITAALCERPASH